MPLYHIRKHGHGVFGLALILFMVARSTAQALSPAEDKVPPRHHELRFNFGMFSAVGTFGATYSYSPLPALEFEAGVGVGFTGVQLSAMPKFTAGSDRHRFVLGAGVSLGTDTEKFSSYWLNVDLGYKYQSPGGFSFLAAGGLTAGLGGRMRKLFSCIMGCSAAEKAARDAAGDKVKGVAGPQFRVALGYAF